MNELTSTDEELDDPIEQDTPDGDQRYHSIGIVSIAALLGLIVLMILVNTLSDGGVVTAHTLLADSVAGESQGFRRYGITPPRVVLSRMKLLDTIYTTDSVYLDLNLTKQNVTVHFRDGASRTFRVSSGSPFISQGMATPTGVFTIQNMVPMAISKQFNNARLHSWIGVQGGVGFHGLDGNGYYGYLGVRPSSHGCIRMSREEIASMYKLVHPGALIMSHYGYPARVVAFCKPDDTVNAIVIDSAAVYDKDLGKPRYLALMEGRYWVEPHPRLVHLAGQRVRWGMPIGDVRKIAKQQLPETHFLASFDRHLMSLLRDHSLTRSDVASSYLSHAADSLAALEKADQKGRAVQVAMDR